MDIVMGKWNIKKVRKQQTNNNKETKDSNSKMFASPMQTQLKSIYEVNLIQIKLISNKVVCSS